MYGQVRRREAEYVGRRKAKIEVPKGRRRGRPKRRWLDVVLEDRERGGVVEEDVASRGCGGRRRDLVTPKWEG